MEQKMKAIIVEDEQASRETLKNYLAKYCPHIDLKAEADSINTGLQKIQKYQPDVVFLDIEMPYGNAFDLLEQLEEVNFEIIFVTAFSNYAVKALNMSAAYYILKPIDIEELVQAVEKVQENKTAKKEGFHTKILIENIKTAHNQLHKIVLPQLDGFEVVQVKDIIRCEAADNFTHFYMMDGTQHMICRTLKFFDELLSEFNFVRVHKSHLINITHVKQYKKGKTGIAKMIDGSMVDVSLSKKEQFLAQFK